MEYDKRLEDDYIAAWEHVQKVKAVYEETQRQQEQYRSELLEKKRSWRSRFRPRPR
jgi:uncharacterized phage-associated protein